MLKSVLTVALLANGLNLLSAEPKPAPTASAPSALPALPIGNIDKPDASENEPHELIPKVLEILRKNYLFPDQVHYHPGEHLHHILDRLHGGASLVSSTLPVTPPLAQVLPNKILYLRLSWQSSDVDWLRTQANLAETQKLVGIILDLRDATSDDLQLTASLATLFLPQRTALYSLAASAQDTRGEPYYTNLGAHVTFKPAIAVLMDANTGSAAELLAAILRSHGALLVGGKSAGTIGVFATSPLNSHSSLRYLAATVLLTDGQNPYGKPLLPDIPVTVDSTTDQKVLAQIQNGQLAGLIADPPHHLKMSEAALVRGENPSLLPVPPALADSLHDDALLAAIAGLQTEFALHRSR